MTNTLSTSIKEKPLEEQVQILKGEGLNSLQVAKKLKIGLNTVNSLWSPVTHKPQQWQPHKKSADEQKS